MSRTSWRSYSLSVLCASLLAACSSGGGGSAQAPSATPNYNNSKPIHVGSTTYQDSRALSTNGNVNVTNDTNLTLKVFDINKPQVQQATQTAIVVAKTGNRNWYLSFDNELPDEVNKVIFPSNVTGSFGSGLASVFLNHQILSTPSSSSSFIDLASDSLNTAGHILDGSGVNIAIIDGYAKTTISGFSKTPINLDYLAPDYLYSIHPEFSKNENPIPYLAEDGSHGTYVGLIIAGKRELSGIAPNANLISAPIRQFDYEIGKVMERVSNYNYANSVVEFGNKVHIINNSYAIPDSENYTRSTTTPARDTYHSIYMAMENIIKTGKDNAPLFVYATGNTNYQKYLENYVLKKNPDGTTVTKDPNTTALQTELLRSLTAQERQAFYDVKFGLKLDEGTALAHLLDNKDIAAHTLTVSGYYLDVSGVQYYIDQTIKDFLLQGKLNYTNSELFDEARRRLHEANLGNRYGIQDQMFLPYPNAIHCGVTKWHCITGDYTFYYPYEADPSSPNYIANDPQRITTIDNQQILRLTGTSFAAPQVSAVAALVKQQFPWMTASQLKQTLLTTARDVGDPGVDEVFGWGIVNAAAAVNGPALFYAGDFDAQLNHNTTVPRNYYFNNSIYGNGGLHVSGNRSDYLYLTGTNQFTGQVLVKSGNLVVANRGLITGFNKDYEVIPQVAAPIAVNSEGRFYAANAQLLSDLTVNGAALLRNTTIGGNLTINPGAILQLDLGQPGSITVKQQAKLLGNLQIIRTQDYVPTTATGSNRATVLISANSLTANLNNYSIDNSALVNSNIYVKGNQLVIDIIADRPSTVSSNLAFARLQSGDAGIAVAGSQQLDRIFAVADAVASAATTNTSATPVANLGSRSTGILTNALPSYTQSAQLETTSSTTIPTLSTDTPVTALTVNSTSGTQTATIHANKFTAHQLTDAQLAQLESKSTASTAVKLTLDSVPVGFSNTKTSKTPNLHSESTNDFNHDSTHIKSLDAQPTVIPNLPTIPQELPATYVIPTSPTHNNSIVTIDGEQRQEQGVQDTTSDTTSKNTTSERQPSTVIIDPTLPQGGTNQREPSLPQANQDMTTGTATSSTNVALDNQGIITPGISNPSAQGEVELATDETHVVTNDNSSVNQPRATLNSPTVTATPTKDFLATAQAIQNLDAQNFLALSYSSLGNAYAGVTQLTQAQDLSSTANWFNWSTSQLLQNRPSTIAYYQGTNLSNQFTQAHTQVQGTSQGYRQDVGILMSNADWSLGVMASHSKLTYVENAHIATGYQFTSQVRSYNLNTQISYLLRTTPNFSYFLGTDLGTVYRTYDSTRHLGSLGQTTAQHANWSITGALGAGYHYTPYTALNFTGAVHFGASFNSSAKFTETGAQISSRFLGLSLNQESNTRSYLQLSQQFTYKFSYGNDWWGQHIPSWKLSNDIARWELDVGAELGLYLNNLNPRWSAQLGREFTQLSSTATIDTVGVNATPNTTVNLGHDSTSQGQEVQAVFNQRGFWQINSGLKLNLTHNLAMRVAYKHQHASTYHQNEISLLLNLKIN